MGGGLPPRGGGASGGLLSANNLSDVVSAPESRINLGSSHDRITVTDKSISFALNLTYFEGVGLKTNPLLRLTDNLTVTLDQDSTDSIPVGFTSFFMTMSGKTTTFAAGFGATVETSSGGYTVVASATEQFVLSSATKRAANVWSVQNGRAASGAQMILTFAATVLTHTNLPAGVQRISNVANRYGLRVDLTNSTTIRSGVGCSGAGAAGSGWYIRYSTDGSAYTDIGSASGSDLALMTAVGVNVSDAISIPAGAKSFVWLEIVSINGDGVADPVTGTLFAIIT